MVTEKTTKYSSRTEVYKTAPQVFQSMVSNLLTITDYTSSLKPQAQGFSSTSMETFPRFSAQPLTDLEIDKVTKEITADARLQQPLSSAHNPTWRSKDLGLGYLQTRPTAVVPGAEGKDDRYKVLAEHFDEDIQRDACEFIGSDIRVEQGLTRPLRWLVVAGLERTFYHYQIYAAFWLLIEERGPRRGTVLADMMGLGKTTVALLYIIFNTVLAAMDAHRNDHSELHLTQDQIGLVCPSQAMWPVLCSCVGEGVTSRRKLLPRHGPSLLFVPSSLLGTWKSEWERMGIRHPVNARLYIQHRDYEAQQLSPYWYSSMHVNSKEISRASQLCVLTTLESYRTGVALKFGNINGLGKSRRACTCPKDHDGIAWARVIRDEAHITHGWETTFFNVMRSFVVRGECIPNLLALTATPILRGGIGDMASLIQMIIDISPNVLKLAPQYGDADRAAIEHLVYTEKTIRGRQLHDEHIPEQALRFIADRTGWLLTLFSIRRRNDTVQNNKALAEIPPIFYYDVDCHNPDSIHVLQMRRVEWLLRKQVTKELQKKQEEFTQKHPNRTLEEIELEVFLENAMVPRIIASLPWLTELKSKHMLTWEHIKNQKWHQRPQESVFARSIASISETCGKLKVLEDILSKLGKDAMGRDEKLVIVSEFPVVCLVVLVFLVFKGYSASWMHAELDASSRESMASEFQADIVDGQETKTPCRIIIGTRMIIGQGITLNRAFRLVLMEPFTHAADELQSCARIHRIGSVTDKCTVYRLLNPQARVEAMVVRDHLNQLQAKHLSEELSEDDNVVGDFDTEDWLLSLVESMESEDVADIDM